MPDFDSTLQVTRRESARRLLAPIGAALAYAGPANAALPDPSARFSFRDFGHETLTGYIDARGEVRIKPQFEEGDRFHEGYSAVRNVCGWGLIDPNGAWLVDPQFRSVGWFSDGLVKVEWAPLPGRPSRKAFLDRAGKMAFRLGTEDDFVHCFHEGRCCVTDNKRRLSGFLDRQGELVIDRIYPNADEFSEGLVAVEFPSTHPARSWGFLDRNGRVAIPPRFSAAHTFSEGLAAVRVGHRYGYIDHAGEFAIPPQFNQGFPFAGGLAAVRQGPDNRGLFGFIDSSGEWVVPPRFLQAYQHRDGLALVRVKQGAWAGIDHRGEIRFPPGKYMNIESFHDGLAKVRLHSPNPTQAQFEYVDIDCKSVFSWVETPDAFQF